MANSFKYFPEKEYKKIINSMDKYHYYLFEKKDTMPGDFFNRLKKLKQKHSCVLAGTGATICDYAIYAPETKDIIIPKGEQVVVARLLRYDDTHGEPHFNADDQLIFPTKGGNIIRLTKKDAPDHYIKIIDKSKMSTIADAYKLPKEKHGSIKEYKERGASLPIKIKEQFK